MSDTTPRSALPLLAAAQSQKHVTHNEALLELDALIATTILDRDLSTPPSTPGDGDTYLVKATGTGEWTGQDNKLAYAIDGGWRFYVPFEGLAAYVADEAKLIFYNGSAWADFASVVPLENLPMLGVNASADSTNKLSVASAAVLFNNIGAGTQVKLNKASAGDTASLLYQTASSARAELGLTGDDNFHVKVSPDGSTFYESLILNRNTGSVLLKHIDISAATTLGATHLGRMVRADASGAAFAVTLPATADADDWVIVRKKDGSANRVTVKDSGGNDMAWLSAPCDEAMFAFWDGAWIALRASIAPFTDVLTASGTWTKPPLLKHAEVFCFSGGSGGGSGRRGAAGSARAGGNGGQGGTVTRRNFNASALSATETVTVGAGGSGGAAQTSDNTNGNAGAAGGTSSFGSHLRAAVAVATGSGGTNAAVAGPTNNGLTNEGSPGAGGTTSITANGGNGFTGPTGGGAAGGGITTGDAAQGGGNGGTGSGYAGAANVLNGGGAGGASGAAGSDGASVSDTANQLGGQGGGGGGASTSGAGSPGGNGGAPGGSGGGGGASVNGNASGAGGNGARGEVRITSHF